MARSPAFVLAALASVGALAPGHARAWTEAVVRSVRAEVAVGPDASAHVTLHVVVRVHGGWLEGMDLAGLDPDLVLDESVPLVAVDQGGRTYAPTARVLEDGRIQLAFPRSSPRRGTVTISLAYRTALAHRATEVVEGTDTVRVRWTLPGWRSGLDGVQIDVLAPAGAELGPRDPGDSGAALSTQTEEREGGVVLRWRRAHLPRTVPWTVAVDVPARAMIEELRGPPVLAPPPPPPLSSAAGDDPRPTFFGLALVLLALALAKMALVTRLAARARSTARPLLGLPVLVRAPLAGAAGVGVALLGPSAPLLGVGLAALIVLAGAYRSGEPPPASQLGAWRPVDQRWLRVAQRASWRRWIAPSGVLDLTTPLGALHAVAWLSTPWIFPELTPGVPAEIRLLASVLPLPLLASGTRCAFPLGPADALDRLLARVRRLRALPDDVALRPVMHVDVRGEVQDARVRTVLAHRADGLLRCDLTVSQLAHAGGWEVEQVLVVVTRAASAAEEALTAALPEVKAEPSRGGRRILRVLPLGDDLASLARVASALEGCPAAPAASRGTAAPQETVHDLPAPRAVGM